MNREFALTVGGIVLSIPCFFPSISSIKANLPVTEYLRVLVALHQPLFVISAYDIYHAPSGERATIDTLLARSQANKAVVLLDSGNYESYWKGDNTWKRENFVEICGMQRFQLVFCFDNFNPPTSEDAVVGDVERSVLRDQEISPRATIVPIVHCSRSQLPRVTNLVAQRLRPILLAVPERELGDGILNRAKMVYQIRCALNELDYYCPLHLLGTGNPLSILVYAACGADSFDGLEWCQTATDHNSGFLFHFHHWDFFSDQTPVGRQTNLPYSQAVLVHNLLFYRHWLDTVRNALRQKRVSELVTNYLPRHAVQVIKREVPAEL